MYIFLGALGCCYWVFWFRFLNWRAFNLKKYFKSGRPKGLWFCLSTTSGGLLSCACHPPNCAWRPPILSKMPLSMGFPPLNYLCEFQDARDAHMDHIMYHFFTWNLKPLSPNGNLKLKNKKQKNSNKQQHGFPPKD